MQPPPRGLMPSSVHPRTVAVSVPDPEAGHCRPMLPLETPEHAETGLSHLLLGHCSFFLGPGAHKVFVCSLCESLFPCPVGVL